MPFPIGNSTASLSVTSLAVPRVALSPPSRSFQANWIGRGRSRVGVSPTPAKVTVGNVISMDDRISEHGSPKVSLRDRRYAIRFPFAADADLLDLETGERTSGVTSDISLGGCFVCSSKPLPANSRVRLTLSRKAERVEVLANVRVVKPGIGMGLEFLDVEPASSAILSRWLNQLRRTH
jgi:PilZ domain